MLRSIADDIKQNFNTGNMVTKLIIVNVGVFVVTALLFAFSKLYPFDVWIHQYLCLSAKPFVFLYKPWTFISHLFIHGGIFHLLWNMVGLNLFGRITGDLLGDRRILPLYIFGGLISGLIYLLSVNLILQTPNSFAMGASGSIMAIAMTAGLIAPDYIVRLLLIGDVKIKYIVAAFIFLDILGTQAEENTGGHFAHLGGALAGLLFIVLYKKGVDVLVPFEKLQAAFTMQPKTDKYVQQRAKMRVEHRSARSQSMLSRKSHEEGLTFQEELDRILDKIKEKGYEKLSQEEKSFLKKASEKK